MALLREQRSARPELYESIGVLKAAFLAAVPVCRPLLTGGDSGSGGAGLGGAVESGAAGLSAALSDGDKLSFYAYFKQATCGDCPEPAHEDDVSMLAAPAPVGGAPGSPPAGGAGPTPRAAGASGAALPSAVAAAAAAAPPQSPAALAVAKAKREAWARCRGMRRRDAMRSFVMLLDQRAPGWDDGAPR